LSNLDSLSAARVRLRSLRTAYTSAYYRGALARALVERNDDIAQDLLAEVYLCGLPRPLADTIERVVAAAASAAAPAGKVPTIVPEFVPPWVFADSARYHTGQLGNGFFSKYVVAVTFLPGTPRSDKQSILDGVRGTVIGGYRLLRVYLVRVPSDSTGAKIQTAVRALRLSPEVEEAQLFLVGGVSLN